MQPKHIELNKVIRTLASLFQFTVSFKANEYNDNHL